MKNVQHLLQKFKESNQISGKGALSVMLVVTRAAKQEGLPLDANKLKTQEHGQVKGLSKSAVQKILKEHGVTQTLVEEGGRTSRGSVGLMEKYVTWLNEVHLKPEDLEEAENWWVQRIKEFLAGKPFKLRIDQAKSVANVIADLLNQAEKRQKTASGMQVQGALMQHLVGAKLSLVLPDSPPEPCGFSVSDQSSNKAGDFVIEDVVIHVTAAPTEGLLSKCADNLSSALKPIIVTTDMGVISGQNLAKRAGIEGRVDIFEIGQFVALNIYEMSKFAPADREPAVRELIKK